jgi:hypothetical protein
VVASTEYRVNIIISSKDKTSTDAKKATKSLDALKTAAKVTAAAFVALKVAQEAIKWVKLGAQVEAVEDRFIAFAGGTEEAEEFLAAFNKGAQNTVDEMTAMEKSAKLLQMGLATDTDEMEQMAAMATKLGDQTISAGKRIDDFSLLLANQAVRRLDNFGMSSGRVRDRIDELLKSGQALNREQAFKMAVLEEGTAALTKLGDTSQSSAVKIEQSEASFANMKTSVAELALAYTESTGQIDLWQITLKRGADILDWTTGLLRKNREAVEETSLAITGYNGYVGDAVSTLDQYGQQIGISFQMLDSLSTSTWDAVLGTTEFVWMSRRG